MIDIFGVAAVLRLEHLHAIGAHCEREVDELDGLCVITKDDNGKLKLSRVPPELIEAVARVRDFGDRKYTDPENWKHIAPERWHEALLRHVLAIWNDPMHIDEESGLPSLWHVACNAAFLCAQDNEVNPYTFCKAIPFAAIIDG